MRGVACDKMKSFGDWNLICGGERLKHEPCDDVGTESSEGVPVEIINLLFPIL